MLLCLFHIGRLYGTLLYPLQVRVLRVEDTPLQHIEEHSFLGVNRTLQEIHIVRSELQEFPTLAFQVRTEHYTVQYTVTSF
jgi:hypothetical protein